MLKKLTLNLGVADVATSVAFYKHLGFELFTEVPGEDGKPVFAIIEAEGIQLMLQARHGFEVELMTGSGHPPLALYFDVEDVAAVANTIGPRARLVKDLHETFYNTREIVVQDPDGYLVTFAQDL